MLVGVLSIRQDELTRSRALFERLTHCPSAVVLAPFDDLLLISSVKGVEDSFDADPEEFGNRWVPIKR